MEIALLVILFLVGTVGGAMQALKYLERRNTPPQAPPPAPRPPDEAD